MDNKEMDRVVEQLPAMAQSAYRNPKKRFCCYIDQETGEGCISPPVWEVWPIGDDPYTFWDACHEHVADMLTDAQIHEIRRIEADDG